MHSKVVHCKRDKYDVYIGRPSKWGNPFKLMEESQRIQVLEMYKDYLLNNPDLLGQIKELKGKVLGCWCAPRACHGDVLAEIAEKDKISQ